MRQDDVEDRLRQLGVEPVDALRLAAYEVVTERDLSLKPTGVREINRERVVVVRHGLAYVVEERAGDRNVAVDARKRRRRGADGLRHGDRVVEQPVPVGLVVVLRRRRL